MSTPRPDHPMTKREAAELLGGSLTQVARAVGISPSAVCQWPDPLPPRLADRVIAARWRLDQAHKKAAHSRFAREQELRRNEEQS